MTVQFNVPKVTEPVGRFPVTNGAGQSLVLTDPGVYTLTCPLPWNHAATDGGSATAVDSGAVETITVTTDPITLWVKLVKPGAVESIEVDFTPTYTIPVVAPPSGPTMIVATADVASTSTSKADDPELILPIPANEIWEVEVVLAMRAPAGAATYEVAFTGPATGLGGATKASLINGLDNSNYYIYLANDVSKTIAAGSGSNASIAVIRGIVFGDDTGTPLTLRLSGGTGGESVIRHKGSFIKATKVA